MASSAENVKLGVCRLYFDGVDMGFTKGGVEVEVTTETHEKKVDQFGDAVMDEVIRGRNCTVKAPLAETTIENIYRLMPGSELYDDGVKATGYFTFSGNVSADDTITVNGTVFTFKASGATGNQINIGASASATIDNAVTVLNASIVEAVAVATYTKNVAGTQLVVTYDERGAAGNAFTLAKSSTNITVSAATLASGADTTKKKVVVKTGVGISLLATAKQLVLHPIAKAANDPSEDFVVPLTQTPGQMSFAYKYDEERVFNCQFKAYPNPVTQQLFYVGDGSAATIAA